MGFHAHRWLGGLRFQSITLKRGFLSFGGHGGGRPFPCAVCRRLLLERVERLARRLHADLVVTGEVAGGGGLGIEELVDLDRSLGLSGRVLRPLSARLLPPTTAESEGRVNRQALLGLKRGERLREDVVAVARDLGLDPWHGERQCLLADEEFVHRLLQIDPVDGVTENLIQLLRFKHFYRLGSAAQVVVALTAEEQVRLQPLFLPSDVRLYVQIPRSPLALVRARWSEHSPEGRETIIAAAAECMAEAAGLPRAAAWVVRFRCEWEGETRQMRLPVEGHPVPALISS